MGSAVSAVRAGIEMIWFLFLFMVCTQKEQEALGPSLKEWPNDADKIVEVCQSEQQLAPICWVYAVTVLGQANQFDAAKAICRRQSGIWKEECYFRLAEEISAKGDILLSIQQCKRVRKFRNNCFSHILTESPTGREDKFTKRQLFNNLGKWEAFDSVLASVEDAVKKDLLLLVLSLEEPRYVVELCQRIETKALKTLCR